MSLQKDGEVLSLREKLHFDEACFLRHLRARQWNVQKALDMVRETLRWRRETKPYAIRCTEIEGHFKTGKNYHHGWTKEGRPAAYMRVRYDTVGDNEGKIKTIIYQMERLVYLIERKKAKKMKKAKKTEEPTDLDETPKDEQVALLFDCRGFGKKNIDIPISKELVATLDHYCERLGVAFIIDTPVIFKAFWGIAKHFVDERTHKKVHFVSGDSDRKKIFPMYFEPENLEKPYGGTHPFVYDPAVHFPQLVKEENRIRKREAKKYGIPYVPCVEGEVFSPKTTKKLVAKTEEDEKLQKALEEQVTDLKDESD
eukprot:TRINITY_DN26_c0_g1_i3.p1 TRINITY_DN26_c0_g1~~TRINITY_DN26_c0_g1_i3.p1  ORF type:complete len:312 (-),score=60.13 TRINITY_DN26_c0_g1_i3:944-1879(-)